MYPGLADQVADIIESMAERPNTHLYAWCVMPDHLHVLAQSADIVEFVRRVKGRATPLARRHEHGRRLWQRSFFDHALRGDESIAVVAQYIFENPVRAHLVETPPDYVWSGSSVWPHWRESYRLHGGRG
jgi:REP element-mobilizing transposase RayT